MTVLLSDLVVFFIFFSRLMILFSHCAVLTSHLIVLLSHLVVHFFFSIVLKTEPSIEPFLKKFLVQPRFLTGFGDFNRTRLAPGSWLNRLDQPVRSGPIFKTMIFSHICWFHSYIVQFQYHM